MDSRFMKLEKKDAFWLVLSVILSIFIIGVFASQAFSVFAETVDFGDTSGYVVCTSEAYANANGDVAKYCCSHGVTCLYKSSQSELVLVDENENAFIGIWWNDTSYSTSASGAFTSGSSVYNDAYYYFNIGYIGNASFLSVYPMFDNVEYALCYADGDSSYLQYATNYDDLVGSYNEDFGSYISNAYFSSLNDNTATFNIVCSNDCPEGISISVDCISVANIYGWSSTDTGYKETSISKFPAEVLEKFVLTSGSYLDTSNSTIYSTGYDNKVPAWDGYLATANSVRGNYDGTLCFKRVGPMGVLLQKRGYCGLSWSDSQKKQFTGGAGKSIMGSFNMAQFDCPSWSNINVNETFAQPLAYQIQISVRDNTNGLESSYPIYLFSTIDGSMRNNWGFSSGGGQSITTTNGNGVSSVSLVDENGSSFAGGNIDNSNIIPYIQSGMGLSGQNGLVAMFKEVLSFLPQEVWVMIFFALSVSVVIMVVKILRGM